MIQEVPKYRVDIEIFIHQKGRVSRDEIASQFPGIFLDVELDMIIQSSKVLTNANGFHGPVITYKDGYFTSQLPK